MLAILCHILCDAAQLTTHTFQTDSYKKEYDYYRPYPAISDFNCVFVHISIGALGGALITL